jgi:hypothetical protein
LLGDLILACEGRDDLRVLGLIGMNSWDDARLIDGSISLLTQLIPKVRDIKVAELLTVWLDSLIAKGSQSLRLLEESLGLALQE